MDHHHGHTFVHEATPGLPEALPAGERILWSGGPRWNVLARQVFHVRTVAVYFAILAGWRAFATVWEGGDVAAAALAALVMIALGAATVAVLSLLAAAIARSTVYTITNKRVVLRYGVALPKAINVPFAIIGEAALLTRPDGTGDIPLTLSGKDHIAYVHLWPHAKPWTFNPAVPMLRAVPQAETVAGVLAAALKATAAPTVIARVEERDVGSERAGAAPSRPTQSPHQSPNQSPAATPVGVAAAPAE